MASKLMENEPTRDDPVTKPGPDEGQGNQEINLTLPSYLGIRQKVVSDRLAVNKESFKAEGWDSIAEFLLDISALLPKPDDPSIPKSDITALLKNRDLMSRGASANDWEESVVTELEDRGFGDRIPQFNQEMAEYRKLVKSIVDLWRKKGML